MIADFHDRKKKKKSTQNGLHFLCLPEIVLHSVYRMKSNDADDNFPKIHLEQCKYEEVKSKGKKNKDIKEKMVIHKSYNKKR